MKVLFLIPSRVGLRGILKKNICPCKGKPLINWTIDQAFSIILKTKVFVSLYSDEILKISKKSTIS